MDVVAHQHIRVNPATRLLGVLAKAFQVETTVIVGDEADLAIVAPLDQVKRNLGKNKAWASRHGSSLSCGGSID